MQSYTIPRTDLTVTRLGYGCMNIGGRWDTAPLTDDEREAALAVVLAAYEQGMNFFDHADIYTFGKSEEAFAGVWGHIPRDRILLQGKCGIRMQDMPAPGLPQRFDFSYDHIIAAVEGSLRRLRTDYLDLLLLHRPDPLFEPEEVARAFDALQRSGKVRYFGVSNHTAAQIALLQRSLDQPLVVNQLELSMLHPYLIEAGIMANRTDGVLAHADGLLDFCRLNDMLVQAWSPVAGGRLFSPPADAPPNVRAAAELVARLAAAKQTTPEGIVLGWLLRHPAPIQPIIGTTKPARVAASAAADTVTLTREEWYALLEAARGTAVP